MSRKTILILLGILLVVLGTWVFVESRKASSTGGASKGILGTLFPFGSDSGLPSGSATGTTPTGGSSDQGGSSAIVDRLAEITKNPTAGFIAIVPPPPAPVKKGAAAAQVTVPVSTTTATSTDTDATPAVPAVPAIVYPTVEYAESGTGYIYTADAKGQNTFKVSDTVIARTAQAFFGDNGASVILQYVGTDNQTVSTYLGHFKPGVDSEVAGTLAGDFLPDGITDLVMSPTGTSFAYELPTDTGAVVMTETTDEKTKKQIFSSPFSEWLLDWYGEGTVITTKAASTVPGYAYAVTSGGVLSKVIGGVNGLTTKMSPDGKNVLYSVSTDTGLALHILHLRDGSDVNTGLATLPEKCVWTADSASVYCGASATLASAAYPDSWYQGSAHFNDAIWQISAASGTTTQLSDGEGNDLDMTQLELDSKDSFLFFINKNDGSLWSFDLAPTPATPAAPALPAVQ